MKQTYKRHKQTTMRQLEDTSWLAQSIYDRLDVEFTKNGLSAKWHCLHTLLIYVREADNPDNPKVYYDYVRENKHGLGIIICDIEPMYQYGLGYDKEGMQCKLRGLAERCKDDDGMYIVHVLTTHDLNSAQIDDVGELLSQIGRIT